MKTTHHFSDEWSYDETYHFHICLDENCTEISDSASHVMTESIVSPTHFEQGFTEHTCTICGYSYIDSITEVIPHTFDNWQNNDAQTHIKICDCGEIVTENHSWDEGSITTEPTLIPKVSKSLHVLNAEPLIRKYSRLFPLRKPKVKNKALFWKVLNWKAPKQVKTIIL